MYEKMVQGDGDDASPTATQMKMVTLGSKSSSPSTRVEVSMRLRLALGHQIRSKEYPARLTTIYMADIVNLVPFRTLKLVPQTSLRGTTVIKITAVGMVLCHLATNITVIFRDCILFASVF
ncbi:hypothetical protein AMTR_s00389p00014340 [Amborella trichopoda]|uniref:Uncharacterized protein n=1 Tax=Amborella trichopoda TaxID=13333 RepID=W1P7M6_AMBTC|nr:hypothetical protein AMTR_s00389p00014340 [Amborella trichopoda]